MPVVLAYNTYSITKVITRIRLHHGVDVKDISTTLVLSFSKYDRVKSVSGASFLLTVYQVMIVNWRMLKVHKQASGQYKVQCGGQIITPITKICLLKAKILPWGKQQVLGKDNA